MNHKRVARIWRWEGFRVPQKQLKCGRLWLSDGPSVRPEPEFAAHAVREWVAKARAQTLFIEPGSPWENGDNERVNGKLWDEFLNVELFNDLREAKVLMERCRRRDNTIRPNTSLGYQPTAPERIAPADMASAIRSLRPDRPSIKRAAMVA